LRKYEVLREAVQIVLCRQVVVDKRGDGIVQKKTTNGGGQLYRKVNTTYF
jgi:hypothetical protein